MGKGKLLLITLIFAILSSWATPVQATSCMNLMKSFMRATHVDGEARVIIGKKLFNKIIEAAEAQEFTEAAIESLKVGLAKFERTPLQKDVESYLAFVKSLKEKSYTKALADVAQIHQLEPKSNFAVTFKKLKKDFGKQEEKFFNKSLKELKRERPDLSLADATKKAREVAQNMTRKYERLTLGCRSPRWTPERKAAGTSFKKFVLGIGAASSAGAYTYQNWDRDIDGKWVGKLGYELTMGAVLGAMLSKITANPENTAVTMALKRYFASRILSGVDMVAYSSLFGISVAEGRARLEAILKDPAKKEELKKLQKYIDKKKLYQRMMESVKENARPMLGKIGIDMDPRIKVVSDVDWNNLTDADLERKEVQEALVAAVLLQMYDQNAGKIIKTGSTGSDRWAFNASYAAVMLPRDTLVTLYIYRTLCMGAMNPKMALMKAIGVYTVNRLIGDQLYFWIRRQAINQ
ncbi:MAG: hypothetical protein HOM21_14235 [Halobacteriovoraceae bacterium]|jgi:hypothetical protein|nr:hypothetical protein [Halobacteriovoraceae bacterium]